MDPRDQFHLGIVTDDVDEAMALLSDSLAYEWGPVVTSQVVVRLPSGECTLEMTCVYSKTEPRLEIIESVPGTHWLPADGSVHHVGYWSDDVAGDSARLADLGYVEEASAGRWSYYRHPSGLRLELIDRTLAGPMAALWT